MKKNYSLILIAFLCFVLSGYGQGLEDFTNSNATASYANNNFVGNNSVTWTYVQSRDENGDANGSGISGNALMLRRASSNSRITSSSVAGGIGDFSVKLYKGFTGAGGRQVELFVNNVSQGTSASFDDFSEHTFTVNNINITGNIVIEIRNITGSQVIVDDISWTSAVTSDLTISGTPTDHGSVCLGSSATTIQYTITNNNVLPATSVTVVSDDPQFVVSGFTNGSTIAGNGSATYNVTFTPTAIGPQNADITVSSTTLSGSTSNLTGAGLAVVTQAVTSNAATLIASTTATLNGNVTTLGTCPSTIEKGFVYSVTATNNNPLNGGTGVTTTNVAGLTTGAYNLGLTTLTPGTNYSFKAYVYNGSTYTYGAVLTFTTISPPPNDDCSGAISLTPSTTCSFVSYTNVNASDSGLPTPSCQASTGLDVWFSVVVPASGEITVETSANGGLIDTVLAFYSGTCGTLTEIACDDDGGTGNMSLLTASGLTVGSTVYIRVLDYQGNNEGTFDICVTSPLPPNTSLDFASATYSVNENGGSVNLCVDISFPSATTATVAEIELTSSNVPHLSFTTATVTFPAGSSAQQCITIPITDNTICGDSKNYSFEFLSITGGDLAAAGVIDTTILTVSDNEGSAGPLKTLAFETGDDWAYTGGGGVNSTTNKFNGTASYRLGGSANITTSNFDISTYTNVKVKVAFAAAGPDSGEDLYLDISYDGGASWAGTGSIKLVDGFSNTNLDIGDTNLSDPTTVASNPWLVNIPDAESQIRVRLRTTGLDAGEYYYVDDIILTGDFCPACTPTHTVTSFAPTSGPIGTEVTINGTGLGSAIVNFDGIAATIVSQSGTEIIVEVPLNTTNGAITVEESGCPIDTSDFTIIDTSGACSGIADLIMTEIYDAASGSLGYIEVFNGTGNTIDLTTYYIRRYGDNARLVADVYTDYAFAPGVTSIANGTVIYGKISSSADTASPDFLFTASGSSGINDDDIFHLRNGSTVVDVYIEPNSEVGYAARRNVNTLGPNNTSNPSDWSQLNTENETDLGVFAFTGGVANFPTVTTSPNDVSGCGDAVFTAVATPGNAGILTYQWYFNDGSSVGWSQVTIGNLPLATVSGETSNELTLSDNYYNYTGYQFYCLVIEDGTCNSASDAAQLKIEEAVWDGTDWSTPPTINKLAIIAGNYDTSIGANGETSFEACQLIVNINNTLNIANNTFVRVQNNLTVNGNIVVKTDGSFVQVNDLAIVDGDVLSTRNKISVEKETAPMATYQEYTYWSSPVFEETVSNGLNEAEPNRIFWFNGQNFRDSTQESGNDDATNPGQDDIDDDNNDWQYAIGTDEMMPGVGYASTHNSIGFVPSQYIYIFEGPFNNGVINVPIYRNDAETNDNNWNFIGNPYPSAIDADDFLTINGSIDQTVGATNGAIFFWSHNTAADGSTNGNQNLNYTQSDYAIINGTGQTAGGDGVVPTRHIPSGQGFFVSMTNASSSTSAGGTIRTTDVVFNNSMRVNGNNNQFFRTTNSVDFNKIRLDLTSDNGVFNQILVGYVDGATNDDDGMFYDATRNLASNASSLIYSLIDATYDKKFAIQGKETNSLTLDEVIPLGFYTSIDEATLYKLSIAQLEGEFMNDNTVYIKDNLMNITHDLSLNDYAFTSEIGEFNNRFEIVFQPESLSVNENELSPNDLTIVELGNGDVKFSVGNNMTINTVEILDVLGRTIYKLRGQNSTETYNLSNLSQATYIARVTISNGQTITKKAVKMN